MFIYTIFALIILQRLGELIIAKRNEAWMKQNGGYEAGSNHYKWMVSMHAAFFVALLVEMQLVDYSFSSSFWVFATLFLMVQLGRVWAITSLGKYWNTKIIVMPKAPVVLKGPYKYIKHPNYTIVTLEFLLIPFLFQAYLTLIVFSLLNMWMLSVRIVKEEEALKLHTDYEVAMDGKLRFMPQLKKSEN